MPENFCIPLFNTCLVSNDDIDLGNGFYIKQIPDIYLNKLNEDLELSSGYRNQLDRLTIGIYFSPTDDSILTDIFDDQTQNTCFFVANLLRIITGVPIDFPFYFGQGENDIDEFLSGTSLIRNYGDQQGRYIYPIDGGDYDRNLDLLRAHMEQLVQAGYDHIETRTTNNRLLRGLEFLSIANQTKHIAPRLVNEITFLEILFSSSGSEITHQLSSCVSWYLKGTDGNARFETYNLIKKIYNARSTIVHGRNIPNNGYNEYREYLVDIENINKEIVNHILEEDHLELFTYGERRRKRELEKLCLGVNGDFLN